MPPKKKAPKKPAPKSGTNKPKRKPKSKAEAAAIIAEPIAAIPPRGFFARLRAWLSGIDDPLITPKD